MSETSAQEKKIHFAPELHLNMCLITREYTLRSIALAWMNSALSRWIAARSVACRQTCICMQTFWAIYCYSFKSISQFQRVIMHFIMMCKAAVPAPQGLLWVLYIIQTTNNLCGNWTFSYCCVKLSCCKGTHGKEIKLH